MLASWLSLPRRLGVGPYFSVVSSSRHCFSQSSFGWQPSIHLLLSQTTGGEQRKIFPGKSGHLFLSEPSGSRMWQVRSVSEPLLYPPGTQAPLKRIVTSHLQVLHVSFSHLLFCNKFFYVTPQPRLGLSTDTGARRMGLSGAMTHGSGGTQLASASETKFHQRRLRCIHPKAQPRGTFCLRVRRPRVRTQRSFGSKAAGSTMTVSSGLTPSTGTSKLRRSLSCSRKRPSLRSAHETPEGEAPAFAARG